MSSHTLTRPRTNRFDPSLQPMGTDAVAVCSVVSTKWQLVFNNPVQVASLPVDFLVGGLPPTACVQDSPTQITLTFAAPVAVGQTWVIPQRSLHVRTPTGGFVAAATDTFDSLYDTFDYPAGLLAGQGPWIAWPFVPGYESLLVRAPGDGGVVGVAEEFRATSLAVGGVDCSRPWSLQITLSFEGPPGAGGSYWYVMLGDEITGQNVLVVDVSAGGASETAMVLLMDDQGHSFTGSAPFAFGARHVVELTWDGTIHRAFVDGVQVAAGTLRLPSTIAAKFVSLFITGDEGAARWTIHDFACRFAE